MKERVIQKTKEKDGITVLFFAMMTVFLVGFMAIIIDIGQGYVYKQQIQMVADTITVSAAEHGKEVLKTSSGEIIVIIPSKAKRKGQELLTANLNQSRSPGLSNFKIRYNYDGETSVANQNIVWDSGVLRVELTGEVKRFIGGGTLKVRVTSAAILTGQTNLYIKDHDVRIDNNRIRIYNGSGHAVFDRNLK